MEKEELELIDEVREKIAKHQEVMEELLNSNNVEEKINDRNAANKIVKKIHIERGRLLKDIKAHLKEINEIYDKYDLYINVLSTIDREENNNYSKIDKINDLKKIVMREGHSPFEEKILKEINDNIDNLDKMKEELLKNDTNGGIKKLVELKDTYSDELKKHRENINTRYKNEFIWKKANIPSLVTVLPKAIALSVKKVVNCIKEQKEAKTNKDKFHKFLNTLKSIGQVAVTPVIYAGKFIIDNAYLLLMLFLLFPDLFPKFSFKGKEKPNESKGDLNLQEQEAEVTVKEGDYSSAINYQTDPRFVSKPENAGETVVADKPPTSAINYQTDPRFVAKEVVPELTDEQMEIVNEANKSFLARLQEIFNFVIGDRNGEIQIIHSAEEYVNIVKEANPSIPITEENAAEYYNNWLSSVKGADRQLIWPEVDTSLHYFATEQELLEYIISGEDPNLTDYWNEFVQNFTENNEFVGFINPSLYNELGKSLGISAGAAAVLYCLYKIVRDVATHGLTIACP